MQNDSELDAQSLGLSESSRRKRQRLKNLTLSFSNFLDDLGVNLEQINNSDKLSELETIERVKGDNIEYEAPISLKTSSLDSSSNYTKFSTSILNTEDNTNKPERTQKARDIYKKILQDEQSNDNDYEINECFRKLQIQEFNTCFFTIVNLLSVYLYHDNNNDEEFKKNNLKLYKICVNFSLVICSISVVCFSKNFL